MNDSDSKDNPKGAGSDYGFQPSYEVKLEVDLLNDSPGWSDDPPSTCRTDDVLCLVIATDADTRTRVCRLLTDSGGERIAAVEMRDVRSALAFLRSTSRPAGGGPTRE